MTTQTQSARVQTNRPDQNRSNRTGVYTGKNRQTPMQKITQQTGRLPLLFAGLTLGWAIWILMTSFAGPHLDISALYFAGWFWGNGQPELIYLAAPDILDDLGLPDWRAATAALGVPNQSVTPFVYPPIWAMVFSGPTHAMAPMTFFKLAYLWHMVALLLTAWAAWQLIPPAHRPASEKWGFALFAILFATWPVLNSFLTNQPQITVNLLILLAFLQVSRKREVSGGALLGLAAAFKIAPILFALIFVLNRNWRALAATLTVAGGIALFSIAVMGWPLHEVFLARMTRIDELIFMTKVNYSPEALLYQLSSLLGGIPSPDGRALRVFTAPEPLWITLLTKAALIAALIALWRMTRGLAGDRRVVVQLFLLSLITALFGPLSWAHYFVLPALLLPALFLIMSAKRAWGWIAAVLIVSSLFAFSVLHRFNHHFMFTALVPTLVYLGLLLDSLGAAHRQQRPSASAG
ncbi:glycosyltransferase family 87 protein [Alisedimentitalea sp. MJ-SS2]|uniref:glycosyltransferase family 87 protein n=1 Tax=Aliisedimentitalea sp. MJ-SS2 TaxID=3049795 RepID=UPI0029125D4E|nr:glycosyltransferase family 87 protein [Alisedimentitalea sp. MJ-SS2]MDU8927331.1 glycosyltransferase family 87 protein [Alisedimentitalea sp. MJ-SS2]